MTRIVLASQLQLPPSVPIVVFALWFAASEKFRQFALSLNPQILTLAQTWRIVGFTFVLLEARGVLPAIFALPAGYGDMAIGATATLAAWKLANPAVATVLFFGKCLASQTWSRQWAWARPPA